MLNERTDTTALDIEQSKKVYEYELENLQQETKDHILGLLSNVDLDTYEQCKELLDDNSITLSTAIDKVLELIRG